MRVLVTGASGAVGDYLVPHLIRRGHQVVATSRTVAKLERMFGRSLAGCSGSDAARPLRPNGPSPP
jgi:uncharacterized protein YbjT (DUF2867 family)